MSRLRATAGEDRVLTPEIAKERVPTPLLAEALAMLHQGHKDELRQHLPALMHSLLPLLELANEELGLNWSLESLLGPQFDA